MGLSVSGMAADYVGSEKQDQRILEAKRGKDGIKK